MTVALCGTSSVCMEVKGYLPHQVKIAGLVSQPQPPLIMPSTALSYVKPMACIMFGINQTFSQPCKGKMFTGVSQGTWRDTKCERGRERESRQTWKSRLGENNCSMDKRALLMGLWAHRF